MFLRLRPVLLLISGFVLFFADSRVFCMIQESPPEEPASVQEQIPKPTEIVVPPSAPRRSHRNPPAVNDRSDIPAINSGSPSSPRDRIIPEGTVIEVRLAENVSTKTHQRGDLFELLLDRDIETEQRMTIPKGTLLKGRIVESVRPGKVKGKAEMIVALDSIQIGEYEYPILTNEIEFEAEATKGSDAKAVGISAGIGAALGALFGGKKGAAVGAAGGAGAGTAGVLLSRGREIELEKERLLSFRLEKDLELNPIVDSGP
jgi:type IV secretion system protein VirB10